VEIDLEAPLQPGISFEAAIAFDPENQTFGVGAFLIDFDLFESEGTHVGADEGIDHTGIVAGQFDVPFGIDWHVYPSIDRMLVSPPLVVESTHGLWNDFGIQAYTERQRFNVVGYVLNGFGYSAAYGPQGGFLGYNGLGYDPADSTITEIEAGVHFAVGGRLGIRVIENLELGTSWAGFFNKDHKNAMNLLGFDAQTQLGDLDIKGEYILHTISPPSGAERLNSGYYVQGLYHLSTLFYGFARYGEFEPDNDSAEVVNRISAGGGFMYSENIVFRLEHQVNGSDGDSDVTYLQVAIGF
jgi:hypothetical protein